MCILRVVTDLNNVWFFGGEEGGHQLMLPDPTQCVRVDIENIILRVCYVSHTSFLPLRKRLQADPVLDYFIARLFKQMGPGNRVRAVKTLKLT